MEIKRKTHTCKCLDVHKDCQNELLPYNWSTVVNPNPLETLQSAVRLAIRMPAHLRLPWPAHFRPSAKAGKPLSTYAELGIIFYQKQISRELYRICTED